METNEEVVDDKLQEFKKFAKQAKFRSKENQEALLKLSVLTGIADYFLDIINYLRLQENKPILDIFNNPLSNLVGKTKDELSMIVENNSIEKIFNFVGYNITEEDFNKAFVMFTQLIWFSRKPATERWGSVVDQFNDIKNINQIIAETGVLKNYDEKLDRGPIAILGSTMPNMKQRFKYAIDNGLQDREFYFLVGDRKININEKKDLSLLSKVQEIYIKENLENCPLNIDQVTETDCARVIADEANKEGSSMDLPKINIHFIDSPANLNFENPALGRPNTEATIRHLLNTDPLINPNEITFISDGANVEPQRIAIERVYSERNINTQFKIIGKELNLEGVKFSQVAGPFAGRLFGVYPRKNFNTVIESEDKKKFRDEHLSYDPSKGFTKYILDSRGKRPTLIENNK